MNAWECAEPRPEAGPCRLELELTEEQMRVFMLARFTWSQLRDQAASMEESLAAVLRLGVDVLAPRHYRELVR